MKRIVIQLSELSRENWQRIYCFIERCLGSKEYREDDFNTMKNNNIDIGIDDDPKQCDVCSITDNGIKELHYEALPEKGDFVFNIIYVKTDEREEFSDFTRFFLLKKKYSDRITLGINLSVLSKRKSNDYKFQLGFFFFFIKNKQPKLGYNSLYIINIEGSNLKANAIPYMNDENEPRYEDASPYIFPLIPINNNNFGIFETLDNPNSTREVCLAVDFLSASEFKDAMSKVIKKEGFAHKGSTVQLFWLLASFISACRDADLQCRIICRK